MLLLNNCNLFRCDQIVQTAFPINTNRQWFNRNKVSKTCRAPWRPLEGPKLAIRFPNDTQIIQKHPPGSTPLEAPTTHGCTSKHPPCTSLPYVRVRVWGKLPHLPAPRPVHPSRRGAAGVIGGPTRPATGVIFWKILEIPRSTWRYYAWFETFSSSRLDSQGSRERICSPERSVDHLGAIIW